MKIIIDADACPKTCLQICMELGQQYGVPVWTVASFNHNIQSDRHVVVGNSSQEADIKVMNLAEPGDIAITQDWGLAAMLLGKGCSGLGPSGREYRATDIEFLLEEREVKAKLRRSGGRTKGPKKRTKQDDQHFADVLVKMIRRTLGAT